MDYEPKSCLEWFTKNSFDAALLTLKIKTMKKIIYVTLSAVVISLSSCGGFADPKEYADAYCECLKGKEDQNGTDQKNLDDCFDEVNKELGKVKKEDISTFRKAMKETECQIAGMASE